MKKIFSKPLFSSIAALLMAVIFFLSYNHYLIDKSLANLKISLKRLDKADNLEDIKQIKDILDDTYLMEVAGEVLDPSAVAKLGLSSQIIDKVAKEEQTKDVIYFVKDVVQEKDRQRSRFLSAIDNMLVAIMPQKRKDKMVDLEKKIEEIKTKLPLHKGKKLQEDYLKIGKLYFRLKEWHKAVNSFKQVKDIDSQNSLTREAILYLGLVYKLQGNYKKAIAIFSQIDKELSSQLSGFAAYQKGDCFYKMGKLFEANEAFEQSFEAEPSQEVNQVAQFRVGYSYLHDFGDEEKAYQSFKKLQELAPGSKFNYYITNKIIPEMAAKYREEGFKFLEEGYRLLQKGKYQESLRQFELALNFSPKDSLSYSGKGLAFLFLKDLDQALAAGRKAKELSPDDPLVLASLGFIYYNSMMFDEAIGAYKEAVAISPDSDVFHYNLGTIYVLKKEYRQAANHLKEALKINPEFAYAYNNAGYIFWLNRRYRETKRAIQKAIGLKPSYLDARYNLGVIHYTLANYDMARQEFYWVDEFNPGFRNTEEYLKEIKEKIGY